MTFEGDNNVLLQQSSNYLLSSYEDYLKTGICPDTPLQTLDFLKGFDNTINLKFTAQNRQELLDENSKYFTKLNRQSSIFRHNVELFLYFPKTKIP